MDSPSVKEDPGVFGTSPKAERETKAYVALASELSRENSGSPSTLSLCDKCSKSRNFEGILFLVGGPGSSIRR